MFCHPDGGAAPAGTRVGHALGTRRAPRGRLSVLALVSGGEAGKASGGENRRPGTRRDVTVLRRQECGFFLTALESPELKAAHFGR